LLNTADTVFIGALMATYNLSVFVKSGVSPKRLHLEEGTHHVNISDMDVTRYQLRAGGHLLYRDAYGN